jgi:long-chain acyl-CoA synthetase
MTDAFVLGAEVDDRAADVERRQLQRQGVGVGERQVEVAHVLLGDEADLLTKGPNVFREYWDDPEATRETFTEDGWLRTGDLGSVDEDGFLSITGSKKDIIITAGGKNLTPANLENDLKQSRWISQAVMYGDVARIRWR